MTIFCCPPDNDLCNLLASGGSPVARFDGPAEAVRAAGPGTPVLLLAGAPSGPDAPALEEAREKGLRLYVEWSECVPGLAPGEPVTAAWERVVVASDAFGPALPAGRILSIPEARFRRVEARDPWLVMARIAGYDTAVFGIPDDATPILFEEGGVLFATVPLSRFVTGRYGPAADWTAVWNAILAWLHPDGQVALPAWIPLVRPAFGPTDPLPSGSLVANTPLPSGSPVGHASLPVDFQVGRASVPADSPVGQASVPAAGSPVGQASVPAAGRQARLIDAESCALENAATWVFRSRLLPTEGRYNDIAALLRSGVDAAPPPPEDARAGDGTFGIQEGYESAIRSDGGQRQRLPIRADCQAETAMPVSYTHLCV